LATVRTARHDLRIAAIHSMARCEAGMKTEHFFFVPFVPFAVFVVDRSP